MGAIIVIVLLIMLNTYLGKLEKADIKKDSISGDFDDYENECHEDLDECGCDGFHQDCDCD